MCFFTRPWLLSLIPNVPDPSPRRQRFALLGYVTPCPLPRTRQRWSRLMKLPFLRTWTTLLATTPGSVSKSWPRPWTYDGKGVGTSGLTAWSRQTKPGLAINTISICLYLLESQDDNWPLFWGGYCSLSFLPAAPSSVDLGVLKGFLSSLRALNLALYVASKFTEIASDASIRHPTFKQRTCKPWFRKHTFLWLSLIHTLSGDKVSTKKGYKLFMGTFI